MPRRPHPLLWAAAGIGVAALVAWPLGGWDTVQLQSRAAPLVDASVGVQSEVVDVLPLAVRVSAVGTSDYDEPDPGMEYLLVSARMTTHVAEPVSSSDYRLLIAVPDVPVDDDGAPLPPEDSYRLDDGGYAPTLNPGVPVDVVLRWQVPTTWAAAHPTVRLGLCEVTRKEGSLLFEGAYWDDPRVVAETDLPVERVEPPAEDEL